MKFCIVSLIVASVLAVGVTSPQGGGVYGGGYVGGQQSGNMGAYSPPGHGMINSNGGELGMINSNRGGNNGPYGGGNRAMGAYGDMRPVVVTSPQGGGGYVGGHQIGNTGAYILPGHGMINSNGGGNNGPYGGGNRAMGAYGGGNLGVGRPGRRKFGLADNLGFGWTG
nr:glycine-rich cell wall structural protein 1.8-like [Halyomorpha halys]